MVRGKPLVIRAPARVDVEAAVTWYVEDAGEAVATRFVAELEQVCARVARHPAMGSPRWGHALNLPGLRHWPLKRFPYLVFFVELDERIEIVRVLHGARDVPASLAESGATSR